MKTKEEIKQLADEHVWSENGQLGFILGYTQCQEDMADKKYTEEDMAKSIEDAWVKYREITNNEDAWLFKQWLVSYLNKQD